MTQNDSIGPPPSDFFYDEIKLSMHNNGYRESFFCALSDFWNSLESVFHSDWHYTRDRIADNNLIASDGTFLWPEVDDPGNNWVNRGNLIHDYHRLRGRLLELGILNVEVSPVIEEDNRSYIEKLQDPRWQKKRLLIFDRDGFTCVECGETKKTLHVHHSSYTESSPWEEPLENLKTLCSDCHKKQHGKSE